MKKQKHLKWLCLLLALLSFLLPQTLLAKEDSTGTITVELEPSQSGRSRQGVKFSLSRLADLKDGEFVYRKEYQSLDLRAEELDSAASVRKALETLQNLQVEEDAGQISDSQGKAVFSDLPLGLYRIHVSAPGEYEQIPDLLVCLPVWNEEEGKMETSITVHAKSVQIPDLLIRKTDENHNPILGRDFAFSAYLDEKTVSLQTIAAADPKTGCAKFSLNLGQTLYIRETQAPEGYVLSDSVIEVSLAPDGQLLVNHEPVSAKEGVFEIIFVNRKQTETKTPSAPKSAPTAAGSLREAFLLLTGAVVLGAAALFMKNRKKQ